MIVYGVDFTSAPSRNKPLTVALGELRGDRLEVQRVERLLSFAPFEDLLVRAGPWVMGCDFPFGLPRRFVDDLDWPGDWSRLVAILEGLGRNGFAATVQGYSAGRPAGSKYLWRAIDGLARTGGSPMNCVRPPVGKMLVEGAPRLLHAGVHLPGQRAGDPDRVVVETYPALLARQAIGRDRYKEPRDALEGERLQAARDRVRAYLASPACLQAYGCTIDTLPPGVLEDAAGDELDAVLCAVQAAWAYRQRKNGFGVPEDVDPVEGWIVDPTTSTAATAADANGGTGGNAGAAGSGYNFAYLDEQTKRMVRRALLKAVAIPGYQVPFASRDMPLPYGWGTGGIQVTAACIGADDVLKVIDQGADDTTNAISIRRFFQQMTGVRTTEATAEATLIQTRHRIPEARLREGQILVLQVPQPEPLRMLEPRETKTRRLHSYADYGLMHVKLYEDIARMGRITTSYDYPVMVANRYLMAPTPTPKFDNPKMHRMSALQLFGAGREKRVYAIPPYTDVISLDFDDHPFAVQRWDERCGLCGADDSYLDEVVIDDAGSRLFCCSDTDYCRRRREAGYRGAMLGIVDQYPEGSR